MNFNDLNRKFFFLFDRLQITRKERVAFSMLFGILSILLISNMLLTERYNYNQENYERIVAEFNKKSALIYQRQQEIEQRYTGKVQVFDAASKDQKKADMKSETELSEFGRSKADEKKAIALGSLNINTAGAEQLMALKGIGEVTAKNIIKYRIANGDFKSAEDLLKVKGIGEKRLESLLPYITF